MPISCTNDLYSCSVVTGKAAVKHKCGECCGWVQLILIKVAWSDQLCLEKCYNKDKNQQTIPNHMLFRFYERISLSLYLVIIVKFLFCPVWKQTPCRAWRKETGLLLEGEHTLFDTGSGGANTVSLCLGSDWDTRRSQFLIFFSVTGPKSKPQSHRDSISFVFRGFPFKDEGLSRCWERLRTGAWPVDIGSHRVTSQFFGRCMCLSCHSASTTKNIHRLHGRPRFEG